MALVTVLGREGKEGKGDTQKKRRKFDMLTTAAFYGSFLFFISFPSPSLYSGSTKLRASCAGSCVVFILFLTLTRLPSELRDRRTRKRSTKKKNYY
ncbi:hypothetical protein GGS23DRAFT_240422 [Durotheca rogersii]|uniref:uncharacterized protein n=1 Tax=Durotheca rogersii TaxID=419775 RepID=UPI00221FE5C0|nr:uncharacterized protein GGS23DRAFT_240422 [Durotheca rogersii]KAI5860224.1 hypothetical protein GGS23DRAFT_240422 [Durotheca rogersii]